MSMQETIQFYKGEGKFKDSDFQKRQEMYKKQNDIYALEENDEELSGMESVAAQMKRLKEHGEEEKIGRFVSANKMDSLSLSDDIELEEVFFVTRELQDGNDSYEIYEVYDKDGNILLSTDKDRNIIAQPALQKMYTPEQLQELEGKVMMRMMRTNPETGKREDVVGVSDRVDLDNEKDPEKLEKDMEDSKENTVYSKIDDSEERDQLKEEENELSEDQIEEKTNGVIVDRIEDPNFYQLIPFAKFRTFLVKDSDGYKFVDGQGNEIKGMEQQNREVYVDDERTDNVVERQRAEMVFSTGRNDNKMAIAIDYKGRINIVDVQRNISQQLDTAGYNVTEKEQEETREDITKSDGSSNIDREYLRQFLNQECRSFSETQIDELYENCQKNDIKQNDITGLRKEVNQILEEYENDGRDSNEHERDRGERTLDDSEDEKARMRRLAGLQ